MIPFIGLLFSCALYISGSIISLDWKAYAMSQCSFCSKYLLLFGGNTENQWLSVFNVHQAHLGRCKKIWIWRAYPQRFWNNWSVMGLDSFFFFFDSCTFKSSWHSKVQLGLRTNWFTWCMWRSHVKRTVPATGSCSVNSSDGGDGGTRGRGGRKWGISTILPDDVRHNVLLDKDDITPVFCRLILLKLWLACPPSHK